jgi:hypothetical protein
MDFLPCGNGSLGIPLACQVPIISSEESRLATRSDDAPSQCLRVVVIDGIHWTCSGGNDWHDVIVHKVRFTLINVDRS